MTVQPKAWYKEPYVWMLIGIPLSSVLVGIYFISLAVQTKDTLVRDNYYKDGLAINQEMQWDKKAQQLGLTFTLTLEDNTVVLKQAVNKLKAPSTLLLKLSHPTLEQFDRDALLQRQGEGRTFKGFIDDVQPGRYYLRLEAPEQQWRIRKEVHLDSQSQIQL